MESCHSPVDWGFVVLMCYSTIYALAHKCQLSAGQLPDPEEFGPCSLAEVLTASYLRLEVETKCIAEMEEPFTYTSSLFPGSTSFLFLDLIHIYIQGK